MKKRFIFMFLLLVVLLFPASVSYAAQINQQYHHAVYIGVDGYGTARASQKDALGYRFYINDKEFVFQVLNNFPYEKNYGLTEGAVYDLVVANNTITNLTLSTPVVSGTVSALSADSVTVEGMVVPLLAETKVNQIVSKAGGAATSKTTLAVGKTVAIYGNPAQVIYEIFMPNTYTPPVKGTSGVATLKNFLATAMEPVGSTLYIYGGGWNWQDTGSSIQTTSIGLSPAWYRFFSQQNDTYAYRNDASPANSYYPYHGYNQYYFAGLDCSGYAGWSIYNTMNTQNGKDGYVVQSTKFAKNLAQTFGYGTWTQSVSNPYDFKAGDIFSMNGHVWICVGVCDDGSIVILHSTPSNSKAGFAGGGVQLSGIGQNANCQAYQLAKQYMENYYPQWSARYLAQFKSFNSFTAFKGSDAGKFSWSLNQPGLIDPDGYRNLTADKILQDLFVSSNSPF